MNREIYTLKVFSTRMEYDSFELGADAQSKMKKPMITSA